MTDIARLKRTIKTCMLDQYGTVVDMQSGLNEIAAPRRRPFGATPHQPNIVVPTMTDFADLLV